MILLPSESGFSVPGELRLPALIVLPLPALPLPLAIATMAILEVSASTLCRFRTPPSTLLPTLDLVLETLVSLDRCAAPSMFPSLTCRVSKY